MKKVILLKDLTPSDISNNSQYSEYVNILEKDIIKYFSKPLSLFEVSCPGCGKEENKEVYIRLNMRFKACSQCGTHYVSPRPLPEMLDEFYGHSDACTFWRAKSLNLPKSKLENLHNPRINWILELADEFLEGPVNFLDFETKYPFLIEQIKSHKAFRLITVFRNRLYEMSHLLPEGIKRKSDHADYVGRIDIITAFDTLERMIDPWDLLSLASDMCRQGGLLLITTATCSGFEYQILGENAPNINPINRMNLLSFEALTDRIESAGFEIIEASTPGRLDAEIVRQKLSESEDIDVDPFWRYLFECRPEKSWNRLQEFLQVNQLSSHVRIAAIKR